MLITELHRHLDVSIRTSTLHRIAIDQKLVEPSMSLERFSEKILITKPMRDLTAVLETFSIFQKALHSEAVLELIAEEATEDCAQDGIDRIEFRFSPAFITEFHPSLTWEQVLSAFERGITRAKEKYAIEVGLIAIISRDYGIDMAERTVDFLLANRDRFVALDLAGDETRFPNRAFEAPFRRAHEAGIHITVHAGESAGADSVWEAVDRLQAERIGHGIHSVEDRQLMDTLKRRKICLEVCPTSNIMTGVARSYENHPLRDLMRYGVPVCINTDDPGVFGVSLSQEIQIVKQRVWLSDDEIRQCFQWAKDSSFI